jgi:hypothetical protein
MIQGYYLWVFEDCAGYCDASTFAAGEMKTMFADGGIIAVREFEDVLVDLCCSGGVMDF